MCKHIVDNTFDISRGMGVRNEKNKGKKQTPSSSEQTVQAIIRGGSPGGEVRLLG